MEKELISQHQANVLMFAILIAAPLIGLAWGALTKRLAQGLAVGSLLGVGNFALWTLYNAITDRLGLDTVKNLLVNLGLFLVIGILMGWGVGWYVGRQAPPREEGEGS